MESIHTSGIWLFTSILLSSAMLGCNVSNSSSKDPALASQSNMDGCGSYVFAKFAFDYFTANRCSVLMPHKSFGKSIYTHQPHTPQTAAGSMVTLALALAQRVRILGFLRICFCSKQNVFSLWRFHFDCLCTRSFSKRPEKKHEHTQTHTPE